MNELIINIKDLEHNISVIKSLESENYTIISVVKGNAYGCSLKEYVDVLKKFDINFFAVASYKEALEFRKYFDDKLLLLTPYSDKQIISDLIEKDIIFTIESKEQAKVIEKYAKKEVHAHIKVDTGLNRYGFKFDDVNSIIDTIKETKKIKYDGIYSHFSNSLAKDSSFSELQYKRFIDVIDVLKSEKIEFKLKHICNSSGYFKYSKMHLNAARIGSAFIGLATGIDTDLKKIGMYHTQIVKIMNIKKGEYVGYAKSFKAKENKTLAVLPCGYFDGIGKTLIDQRFSFKSKVKKVLLDTRNIFKTDYHKISDLNIIGQIGMQDVVVDITGKDYKLNDDLYFYYKPSLIDTSVKRVFK